ncbi:hypothetical protein GH733_004340 [Mirounga leonina]|nr:hypothetical protein GH733_004340 [Mirounga leonina]
MVVARAWVLGVQWLKRAARTMVPLGTTTALHITKDTFLESYHKIPEEQATTAKKYMCVEDYQVYWEDGMGYDDYLKLSDRSGQGEIHVGETYLTYQSVGLKQNPYNNLYLEQGRDPTKQPEPVVHYEI